MTESHNAAIERVADLLEVEARGLVGHCASIDRSGPDGGGLIGIDVQPDNPNAAPLNLIVMAGEVVVTVGAAGRYELGCEEADLGFAAELMRAVVAGRVTAWVSRWQETVTVTLGGGRRVSSRTVGWGGSGLVAGILRLEQRRLGFQEFEPYDPSVPIEHSATPT